MDLWCFVPFYCASLAKALQEADLDVTLVSINDHRDLRYFATEGVNRDPGLLDVVTRLGVRNRRVRQGLKLLEASLNLLALGARFFLRPPDILHVQYIPTLERGLQLETLFLGYAQWLRIPVVYTVHNVLPHDTRGRHREDYGHLYRGMDALICHTQESRRQLVEQFGVDPERVWTIPHGPLFSEREGPSRDQARRGLGLTDNTAVVLWQGIVKPYKGLRFLLDAWRNITREGMSVQLVIAGSGEIAALEEVRQMTRERGLQDLVRLDLRFLSVDEVSRYYQAADILVYPYENVTQSGALLTGLSFGKAIVATSLPAFQEVLGDGDRGILVPYGDVPALTGALRRLILDPGERLRMAHSAQEWTRSQYSWRDIGQQTRRCFETVTQHEGRP